MTNGTLYNLILAILRKESRGNLIKPNQFSSFLVQANHEYYNQQYEKWAGSQTILDSLKPFLVLDASVTFAAGSANISSLAKTYKHLVAARVTTGGYKIEIVTPSEWNEWAGDVLMQGSATAPLLTVDASTFKILPTTVTGVTMTYLKEADSEPFFDYYIDAYRNVQYLTPAQVYALGTGEVYRTGTSTGSVTSISKELEWSDFDKINIVSIILEKIGVSLNSADVTQYAMALEQKQNTL